MKPLCLCGDNPDKFLTGRSVRTALWHISTQWCITDEALIRSRCYHLYCFKNFEILKTLKLRKQKPSSGYQDPTNRPQQNKIWADGQFSVSVSESLFICKSQNIFSLSSTIFLDAPLLCICKGCLYISRCLFVYLYHHFQFRLENDTLKLQYTLEFRV